MESLSASRLTLILKCFSATLAALCLRSPDAAGKWLMPAWYGWQSITWCQGCAYTPPLSHSCTDLQEVPRARYKPMPGQPLSWLWRGAMLRVPPTEFDFSGLQRLTGTTRGLLGRAVSDRAQNVLMDTVLFAMPIIIATVWIIANGIGQRFDSRSHLFWCHSFVSSTVPVPLQ